MNRRQFNSIGPSLLGLTLGLSWDGAQALSLENLEQGEMIKGLKEALVRGARVAIAQLGQVNGYLGNGKVRIPLPARLEESAQLLRRFGQGQRLDELVEVMNRAAEKAVPEAKDMLLAAVGGMTVNDAKKILTGGDTSVTSFFAEKTRESLEKKFLPVVARTTDQLGLVRQYNQLADKAADFGLMNREEANIKHYVTSKALNGLYYVIGEEERKIRKDPVGTGSALLGKVFGVLK